MLEARGDLEQTVAEQRNALYTAAKGAEMSELDISTVAAAFSPFIATGEGNPSAADPSPAKKMRDEALALRDRVRAMKEQGSIKDDMVWNQIRTLGERESRALELVRELEDGKTTMALLEGDLPTYPTTTVFHP